MQLSIKKQNQKPPLVSVIIPAFNQWPHTAQCLHSLRTHTPGVLAEVVVVDNGSTDATAAELEGLGQGLFGERFTRIRLEENRNFGPGCNLGAAAASGQFLFFLNNDTLLTEGWLPPLLEAFQEDPRLGGAGPLLTYPDTARVQHLGVAFSPTLGLEHLYSQFPSSHPVVGRKRFVQALTGAALFMPASLFQACDGFFAGYVNGSEDLDLCCRLRQQGKRLRCAPKSRIHHLESRTPGRFDHDDANAALLRERCAGGFAPDLHHWTAQDGFEIALTPWLDTYVRLPPEREAELAGQSGGQDPARIWEMLCAEPLWRAGYDLLGEQLQRSGAHAEATYVWFLQAWFFPEQASLRALLAAAARAGNDALRQEAAAKLQRIERLYADKAGLAAKAKALAGWACAAGEESLHRLYAACLKELPGAPL